MSADLSNLARHLMSSAPDTPDDAPDFEHLLVSKTASAEQGYALAASEFYHQMKLGKKRDVSFNGTMVVGDHIESGHDDFHKNMGKALPESVKKLQKQRSDEHWQGVDFDRTPLAVENLQSQFKSIIAKSDDSSKIPQNRQEAQTKYREKKAMFFDLNISGQHTVVDLPSSAAMKLKSLGIGVERSTAMEARAFHQHEMQGVGMGMPKMAENAHQLTDKDKETRANLQHLLAGYRERSKEAMMVIPMGGGDLERYKDTKVPDKRKAMIRGALAGGVAGGASGGLMGGAGALMQRGHVDFLQGGDASKTHFAGSKIPGKAGVGKSIMGGGAAGTLAGAGLGALSGLALHHGAKHMKGQGQKAEALRHQKDQDYADTLRAAMQKKAMFFDLDIGGSHTVVDIPSSAAMKLKSLGIGVERSTPMKAREFHRHEMSDVGMNSPKMAFAKAAMFGFGKKKPDPKPYVPDHAANLKKVGMEPHEFDHLVKHYEMDHNFTKDLLDGHADGGFDKESFHHNVAFMSHEQKKYGGPGKTWDAEKWGGPHPEDEHEKTAESAASLRTRLTSSNPAERAYAQKGLASFAKKKPSGGGTLKKVMGAIFPKTAEPDPFLGVAGLSAGASDPANGVTDLITRGQDMPEPDPSTKAELTRKLHEKMQNKEAMHPAIVEGLTGAGVGAGVGALSSLRKPKGERLEAAKKRALGGAVIGGGAGLLAGKGRRSSALKAHEVAKDKSARWAQVAHRDTPLAMAEAVLRGPHVAGSLGSRTRDYVASLHAESDKRGRDAVKHLARSKSPFGRSKAAMHPSTVEGLLKKEANLNKVKANMSAGMSPGAAMSKAYPGGGGGGVAAAPKMAALSPNALSGIAGAGVGLAGTAMAQRRGRFTDRLMHDTGNMDKATYKKRQRRRLMGLAAGTAGGAAAGRGALEVARHAGPQAREGLAKADQKARDYAKSWGETGKETLNPIVGRIEDMGGNFAKQTAKIPAEAAKGKGKAALEAGKKGGRKVLDFLQKDVSPGPSFLPKLAQHWMEKDAFTLAELGRDTAGLAVGGALARKKAKGLGDVPDAPEGASKKERFLTKMRQGASEHPNVAAAGGALAGLSAGRAGNKAIQAIAAGGKSFTRAARAAQSQD